jgi:hypothetical protein
LECNILGLPHQLKTVPEPKLFHTVEKEAARGGVAALLVFAALSVGYGIDDIRKAAKVSERTLLQSVMGTDWEAIEIYRILKGLDLTIEHLEFAVIELMKANDPLKPEGIRQSIALESAKLALREIINTPLDEFEIRKFDLSRHIRIPLLVDNFEKLFQCAYKARCSGFYLAMRGGPKMTDLQWSRFLNDHQSEHYASDEILNRFELFSTENLYYPSLTQFLEEYWSLADELGNISPRLEFAILDGDEYQAVKASANGDGMEPKFLILSFISWEVHRSDDDFSPLSYFFYWLSDTDGRDFLERIFLEIRNKIQSDQNSLVFFVHRGYFNDEVYRVTSGGREVTLSPPPWSTNFPVSEIVADCRPLRFFVYQMQFGELEQVGQMGLDEGQYAESCKVLFSDISGLCSGFRSIPIELPFSAFQLLFQQLGYFVECRASRRNPDIFEVSLGWSV